MSFDAETIGNAVSKISNRKYLLPSIQREFVWRPHRIVRLFDSLMRGYPINSFLFWHVEGANKHRFRFYEFLRVYRQAFAVHNAEASMEGAQEFRAVLDGQQRLTSLYLGLKGTYAYKRPRVHWADTEYAMPTRKLFLNVSRPSSKDDMEYHFRFLIESDMRLEHESPFSIDGTGDRHLLVGRILDYDTEEKLDELLDDSDLGDSLTFTRRILRRLQRVIHTDPLINYYVEQCQEIDTVVSIFIRTNSGGVPLSFSDLLLSMATAGWVRLDARKEINRLVDELNDQGMSFTKDFILKSLLVHFSNNIRFKIDNFDAETIGAFEAGWEAFREAVTTTVRLAKRLGFGREQLSSHNALIPIIYYLHRKGYSRDFETAVRHEDDRRAISRYLHVALLTQLFSGQSDRTLSNIRDVINQAVEAHAFPLDAIRAKFRGTTKDLAQPREFIEGLLTIRKDDRRAFSVLSLLYPRLDYDNRNYDKDHLHPEAGFTAELLQKHGIESSKHDFYLDPNNWDTIVNLQLLDANQNKQKSDKPLSRWIAENQVDLGNQLIPRGVDLSFQNFEAFIQARRQLLVERLAEHLS